MEPLIRDFVRIRNWAVVGATKDPAKYGNTIVKIMRGSGYKGTNRILSKCL
jgi:predicted CoA-binding protein